jgi:glycine oxidase
MKKKFDFIIVGQGLAGTILSLFLLEKGKSVFVIDKYDTTSSSNIAAGIIHPITGRRLVKSWLLDEAYPIARKTYLELENKFSENFFKEISIIEIFTSVKNRNDWIERSGTQGYEHLIGDELPANFNPSINCNYGAIKLKPTGFLLIRKLIDVFRKFLIDKNVLINENFEFEELKISEQSVEYKHVSADKIIFCEGYHAQHNPSFRQLPYKFAKGEIIKIKCENLIEDFIINKGVFIQPLGDHLFRVGATYDWDHLNNESTEEAKKKLVEQFASIVSLPFTVVEHEAAVRPTMKNRRPVMGLSLINNKVGIFNGLGTKGVLLAPLLANNFAEHLINGKGLNRELYDSIHF